ncbi:MAG: hypothetical protein HQL70_04940 [Magnetococcales bacterium]|nr:hypothetical protein [Magnetococcales bacterium]
METKVCPVEHDDYEQLANCLYNYRNTKRSQQHWLSRFHHWWENNPLFKPSMPRGFLLRSASEQVVGFFGIIPTLTQIGGDEVPGFAVTTWYVERAYQKNAAGRKLLAGLCEVVGDQPLWMMGANHNTTVILKRLKKTPVPFCVGPQTSVLSSFGYAWLTKLEERNRPGRVLSAAQRLLPAIDRRTAQEPSVRVGSLTVKELDRADNSFDQLWQENRSNYANIKVRNSEILNWYCFGLELVKKRLFACYEAEKLLCFAIVDVKKLRGRSYLQCVDVWGYAQKSEAYDALFSYLLALARKSAMTGLISFQYPGTTSWFKRQKFSRQEDFVLSGFCQLNERHKDDLLNKKSYFGQSEGDVGM